MNDSIFSTLVSFVTKCPTKGNFYSEECTVMVGKACYKATGHIVFLAWKQRELAIGTNFIYISFMLVT